MKNKGSVIAEKNVIAEGSVIAKKRVIAEGRVIVEGKGLSKSFNGNPVLKDVSIQLREGEGLALCGENGAGKSTLMNILSGGMAPSSGIVLVDGRECRFFGSGDGKKAGIAFVHQELSLMKEMTAGENIMLGQEPKKGILIDQKELHRQAKGILKGIGYEIDECERVKTLSPPHRQIVEIAKAWAAHPRVLILDEPTSSLNKAEADKLFLFINRIKKQGVSIVVISHRMEDIFASCERVVVLKDGSFVFASSIEDTNSDEIISKMVGREFKNVFPPKNEMRSKENKLELKHVSGCQIKNVSLSVPRGAVIGIGGLEGQGQRHLSRGLFGIEPFVSGEYVIDGKIAKITSPTKAVKNKIAFISDDRKAEGLFLDLSCGENILSLSYGKISRWGFLKKLDAEREIKEGIEQLNIKLANHRQPVKSLSGGSQQKVVFSRWMKTQPEILILHEPTRGIDVQTKLEIYGLIRKLAGEGVSTVVFTSDMLELIGLSDEIYVMYEGGISGHISGKEATEEEIMRLSANAGKEAAR